MLSLVLPTYNEAANITSLIDVLDVVLHELPHEIIVVDDDSPDGTWKVVEHVSKKYPTVRVLRRVGRRGLSSAVVEGFDMARGDMLAVMDADGQHDASLLLTLVASLKNGADIALGSRYMAGGSVGDWVTDRRIISKTGTALALSLSRVRVTDPLGGFFALKASFYKKVRPFLKPTGFKILLEILSYLPPETKVAEIPLIFRMRLHGRSKLSMKVHLDFVVQVLRLAFGKIFSGSCVFCGAVFVAITMLLIPLLASKAWDLRLLVLHPELRLRTAAALKSALDKEGWIFSDVTIERVTEDSLTLLHREHRRHPSPPKRCQLSLATSALVCDE